MPAHLLSNATAVLREVIQPYVQDNFPKQTILLDQMKRNSGVATINNAFHAAVRTSRHGGVTNLANDGNNINATAGVTFNRGSVAVKTVTGAFNISKLAIDASQGDKRAIANTFTEQAKAMVSDFAREVNRQLYGDATGIVAQVNGSVSSTEITIRAINASVDDGRTIDYYGTVNSDIAPGAYLQDGMVVGIGTAAAATGTIGTITNRGKDLAVGTVLLTGATASAANDAVFILDGSGGGAGSNMFNGIREALSSTTGTNLYAGLARSRDGWTPQFGSVSEALSLSRMENGYLSAKEYARTGDQYAIFVNKTLYKKYGDLLTSMRRTVDTADLLGGWTGLEFAAGAGKVGVFLDYQVPDGEVVILNMDSWTLCQVEDMNWLEQGADNLLRLSNTITYQAVMVWFANVMCLAPAANARETQKTD